MSARGREGSEMGKWRFRKDRRPKKIQRKRDRGSDREREQHRDEREREGEERETEREEGRKRKTNEEPLKLNQWEVARGSSYKETTIPWASSLPRTTPPWAVLPPP